MAMLGHPLIPQQKKLRDKGGVSLHTFTYQQESDRTTRERKKNLTHTRKIQELITNADNTGNALTYHQHIRNILNQNGYETKIEQPTPYRNDQGWNRKGRIDLIAQHHNTTIAIEIDRKTPRRKSVIKLKNYQAHEKLIITRDDNKVHPQ